jgi:Ca2+-binding EF-hand superfamily protein
VLPTDEVARLRREFERLDREGLGRIPTAQLVREYGLHTDYNQSAGCMASDLLETCQDGFVDLHDFMRLLCPDGYRLPNMEGSIREVFHHIVEYEACEAKTALRASETVGGPDLERPAALRPLVGWRRWRKWTQLFASIDRNRNGSITARELVTTNMFSQQEALAIVSILTPENSGNISLSMFLTALLNTYGFRITDPDGRPLNPLK